MNFIAIYVYMYTYIYTIIDMVSDRPTAVPKLKRFRTTIVGSHGEWGVHSNYTGRREKRLIKGFTLW